MRNGDMYIPDHYREGYEELTRRLDEATKAAHEAAVIHRQVIEERIAFVALMNWEISQQHCLTEAQ